MEKQYFKDQLIIGASLNQSIISLHKGYYLKKFDYENDSYVILTKDIKNPPPKTTPNVRMLSKPDKYGVIVLNEELSSVYSKQKERELLTIIKINNRNKRKLNSKALIRFFSGENILSEIKKGELSKSEYTKNKIKKVFYYFMDLLIGDLNAFNGYYSEICSIKIEINKKKKKLSIDNIDVNAEELIKKEIETLEKQKLELTKEKNQTARGFSAFIISLLSLFILAKQVVISNRQTRIQETQLEIQNKQLSIEKFLNLPSFNLYSSLTDDFESENLYIKKNGNACISDFSYDIAVIFKIITKDGKTFFYRVNNYYNNYEYPNTDETVVYGALGSGNLKKYNEIEKKYISKFKSIELLRLVRLNFKDFEDLENEQYYLVIPFFGTTKQSKESTAEYFSKNTKELNLEELEDFLQSFNSEPILKAAE